MRRRAYVLAVLFSLTASFGFSQKVGNSYDLRDSSLIPSKRMPQHTEFLNGTYNYPAKPRSQWEVGVKAGLFQISGDIPAQFLSPGFGFHVRKSLGYTVSARVEYMYGIGRGYSYKEFRNFARNTAWGAGIASPAQRYSAPRAIQITTPAGTTVTYVSSKDGSATTPLEKIFYNYKAKVQDFTVQALLTINNIQFHKTNSSLTTYAIAGAGAAIYETRVNALNGDVKYNFNTLTQASYKDRKDFVKNMKNNILDGSFETPAEN
ncbi:MAG: hypothetical protein EBR98_03915, partial [Chitinophagaceae bacterium]|nr:hypothetical protein [Chitinophagaceae bacterium]